MSGKGDEALSNKLGHLLDATADPAKITGSAKFQGALSEGRQLCQVAKNDLDQAVADSDADEIENATTARSFELALKAVLAELTYVWKKGKDRLLNLAPEEREELDEVEYLRREEFFAVNLDVPGLGHNLGQEPSPPNPLSPRRGGAGPAFSLAFPPSPRGEGG